MATLVYSQYSDESHTALCSYFGVAVDPEHFPQDPESFPNQCVIASDDPLYVAYYNSYPWWVTEWWVKPGE